jgi:hypothetical protein
MHGQQNIKILNAVSKFLEATLDDATDNFVPKRLYLTTNLRRITSQKSEDFILLRTFYKQ